MVKEYNDLIGEILDASKEKDQYKGKGKPIPQEYFQKDTFQHFQQTAKNAGFLPPWLELQKEVSELVHSCKSEEDIEKINEKIRKYNMICPIPMQKRLIKFVNINAAKEIW